ncbi:hypothetical protein [Albibacterium bauzanense]|uniref:Uncharacterized protein n=1 Tax=Albibacterium bauzanense TaxID=653929 RepID=A0A4R1M2B0_9SPHI|nr:hypothetical protein [Albibacterium bauzanense]TCK85140.1 hypothetical protein C8N28_0438 [Albibacterium bauzanense]
MIRFICLLVFALSINPSFGQDVEDEYMIELAKELFLGLPIKSDLPSSLSLLKESNKVDKVTVLDENIKATFISHPILNINSIKGDDRSGSADIELLFYNNQIFERRIIVNNQCDLTAFNTLYNLLKAVSFHIEAEKPVTDSTSYRRNTLFTAKDGRNLAHIELSYNPALFNPERDLTDKAKTIAIVFAIYDNTLY